MEMETVYIIDAKRTPIGNMLGQLSPLTAPELNALTHEAVLNYSGVTGDMIDEVISGCVLQAGLGQAPARQAMMLAGIPSNVPATTINKMCGSGLKSVMLGVDAIVSKSANVVLSSGMESMSNAPYLLNKARQGYRIGHQDVKDSLFLDGLEDAYEKGILMGVFAERAANHFNITREKQDDYATLSLNRALQAIESNAFVNEMVPVHIQTKKELLQIVQDECPTPDKLQKIATLKPAFSKEGTITAANASSISDGAASILLMSKTMCEKRNIKPIAKILAHATHAQAPEWFTTAPIDAIKKVLAKANWSIQDVDLFEINEAFAVVSLIAIQQLSLDINKVNVHGGACALGHPIGASGARILTTLIHALKRHSKKRGIASLCIGGGEAVAIAIELIN